MRYLTFPKRAPRCFVSHFRAPRAVRLDHVLLHCGAAGLNKTMASSSRETESSPSRGIGMKRRRNIRAVGILSVFLISLSLQTGNAERFRSSDSIRGMQQDHTSSSSYVSHVQSDRRNRKGDKRVVVKRGILGGGDIHRQLPSSRGKGGGTTKKLRPPKPS